MKQHLFANDWGPFEREHPKEAARFRAWLDERDYPQDPSGCKLYDVQPVYLRTTIGRLIEFLSEQHESWREGIAIDQGEVLWHVYTMSMEPDRMKPALSSAELLLALWAATKKRLEIKQADNQSYPEDAKK